MLRNPYSCGPFLTNFDIETDYTDNETSRAREDKAVRLVPSHSVQSVATVQAQSQRKNLSNLQVIRGITRVESYRFFL